MAPGRSTSSLGRMNDQSESASPAMVASVQAALGRCVLLYQGIELVLKLSLPHVRATEEEALQNSNVDWRELLDSKKTLGQLVGVLMDRTSSSSKEDLASWLQTVVSQRNEVVHHFYDQSFAPLRTRAQVDEALAYLQLREGAASMLFEVMRTIALGTPADDAPSPSLHPTR